MSTQAVDDIIKELESEGISLPDKENSLDNINNREIEVINSMQESTGLEYSQEQLKILRHHGSCVIIACAGSGKTSVSTHLIAKRILCGEITNTKKLIYTTYSKAGQLEMKQRIDLLFNRLGIYQQVEVRTLHSFFLEILRTFGVNNEIINESTRVSIIKQGAKNNNFDVRDDDLQTLNNLLSYQVNNLMSDSKVMESSVNTLDDLTLEQYTNIRQYYASEKNKRGMIDYDDMQSFIYYWVIKCAKSDNPQEKETANQVLNYCKGMFDYFFVDEAQDVSKIQYAILRAIVSKSGNKNQLEKELVFIGDEDQAIYSWRGSDPSIILSVGSTFNISTFLLSTNYRCKSEIVNYAKTGIVHNTSRYEKGMSAYKDGGNVEIKAVNKENLYELSKVALEKIEYWINNGIKHDDIAVLSRNNFHLALLNNMLMRKGIYSEASAEMKLTKSYMYDEIKSLIELSDVNSCKSHLTAKMLWKLCTYMKTSNSTAISKFQSDNGLSFKQLIGYITVKFIDANAQFDSSKLRIVQAAFIELDRVVKRLSYDSLQAIKQLYEIINQNDRAEIIKGLMHLYRITSAFLYKSLDKSRSIDGLIIYINRIIEEDNDLDKTLEFLRLSEQLEGGTMVVMDDKITLSTIHSAKGREWKNVIMFACDNVSEPPIDYINKMIQIEMNVHDINNYIDEERRLFYVGNTRAKENLFVITYQKSPSIFLLEALGSFNGSTESSNNRIFKLAQDLIDINEYLGTFNVQVVNENGHYHAKDIN